MIGFKDEGEDFVWDFVGQVEVELEVDFVFNFRARDHGQCRMIQKLFKGSRKRQWTQ
jgi:hypothetical protein